MLSMKVKIKRKKSSGKSGTHAVHKKKKDGSKGERVGCAGEPKQYMKALHTHSEEKEANPTGSFYENWRKYCEEQELLQESLGQTKKWLKQKKMDSSKSKDFLLLIKDMFQRHGTDPFYDRYGEGFLNKYIFWVVKNYFIDRGDGRYGLNWKKMMDESMPVANREEFIFPISGESLLIRTLEQFADLVERGFIPAEAADIYKLRSFENVLLLVAEGLKQAMESTTQKEAEEENKRKAYEEADVLDAPEGYRLVRPHTRHASTYFGQRCAGSQTKWCIATERGHDHYQDYTSQGIVFYFIINENLDPKNDLRKIAVAYDEESTNPRGYGEIDVMNPHAIFDAPDDQIDMGGVRDGIEENHFGERFQDLKNLYFRDDDSLSTDPPTAEELISFKRKGIEGLDALIKSVSSKPLNEDELIKLSDVLQEGSTEIVDRIMDEIFTEIRVHLEAHPPYESQQKIAEKIEEEYQAKMKHVNIHLDFDGEHIYYSANMGLEFGADLGWVEDVDKDKIEEAIRYNWDEDYILEIYIEGDEEDGFSVSIGYAPDGYRAEHNVPGFKSFCEDLYENTDQRYDEFREDTIQAFAERGLIKSEEGDFLVALEDEIRKKTDLEVEDKFGGVYLSMPLKYDLSQSIDGILINRGGSKKWDMSADRYSGSTLFPIILRDKMAQLTSRVRDMLLEDLKELVLKKYQPSQMTLPGIEKDPKKEIKPLKLHELLTSIFSMNTVQMNSKRQVTVTPALLLTYKIFGEKGTELYGDVYREMILLVADSFEELRDKYEKDLEPLISETFKKAVAYMDNHQKDRMDRMERERSRSGEVVFENKRKLKIRILKS